MENLLTIGQLAKQVGCSIVTIRYYERRGLLPESRRSDAGYRLYSETLFPRFHFIKNAKSVGFTLSEIKILLDLQQQNTTSQAIKDNTLLKISAIEAKIKVLNKMKGALKHWAAACDGKVPLEQCPILEQLYSDNTKK